MDPELDAARAGVAAFHLVSRTDVAQEARGQRAMNGAIAFGPVVVHRGLGPVELVQRARELRGHVAPFPHARNGEEVLAAGLLHLALEELRELQEAEEIRAFIGEARVALVRRRRLVERTLARVLHRERAGDHAHLREAALLARRDQHAADARVERQARELASHLRQLVGVVHGAELGQQGVAIGDGARARRIEEWEVGDFAEPQALRAQDHRGERGAQQFRVGECRALGEVLLGVKADANAVRDAPAAARALARRRLRDRLDAQHLHLLAIAVTLDAREAAVDHVTDARHGERSLRDVGGEHHTPCARRFEHAILLGSGEPGIERQDLEVPEATTAQRVGGVADLALAGQEHQHVAGAFAAKLVDRVGERRLLLVARGVFGVAADRTIAQLDRIQAARHFDHRCAIEVAREALGVNGGGGHDDPELGTARHQAFDVTQQEVDVQAALVRLIQDDRVVLAQFAVALRLGEQDAVGHQLERGARPDLVVEAHLAAHQAAELGADLFGDARGHGACGDSAWLRMADPFPVGSAPHLQQHLRQLRRLSRTGLAADDDHRVALDRRADVVAPRVDRQCGVEADAAHARASYPPRCLPLLVAAGIGAVALDVFLQELELALLRVLRKLPAVMRGLLGAGAALTLQVGEQVSLDAAPLVRGRADEEEGFAAPQDVDATPLVRRVLDGTRREWPLRAPHRHTAARYATVVP